MVLDRHSSKEVVFFLSCIVVIYMVDGASQYLMFAFWGR